MKKPKNIKCWIYKCGPKVELCENCIAHFKCPLYKELLFRKEVKDLQLELVGLHSDLETLASLRKD